MVINKVDLTKEEIMSTLENMTTQQVVTNTFNQSLENLLRLLDEQRLWLTIEEYAKYHGTSKSSVEKAISNGVINTDNGGLKKGCEKPKAKKLIFRFFNHLIGRVDYPNL